MSSSGRLSAEMMMMILLKSDEYDRWVKEVNARKDGLCQGLHEIKRSEYEDDE
jgi:hypothetical protein